MYCKRAAAYLLNKHQLGVQLGLNLIIYCFDFIWNKTKQYDAAFWQVLVCLRRKLHHSVCSDVQSSLMKIYCTLKCKHAPFTDVLSQKHKKAKISLRFSCFWLSKDDYLIIIKHLIICNHWVGPVFKSCWRHFSFYGQTYGRRILATFAHSMKY